MDDARAQAMVERLRALGNDDEHAEAKTCATTLSKDVWESVSAFANTVGGTLLLGIDEREGFGPASGFDPGTILAKFVEGIGEGGGQGAKLTNPPHFTSSTVLVDGQPILAIEIHENSPGTKPCYITARGPGNGAYKRVGDRDERLSATEIFEMQNLLVASPADREPVIDADVDDLDDDLLDRLIAARKGSRALHGTGDDRGAALQRLNITARSGEPRLAGLLTMGSYPQQYFPQLLIDVSVHPHREKADSASPLRFLDRELCDGPLGEAVAQALRAVTRNLRTYSVISGASRIDQLEIPLDVLREAIANAVLHREYGPLFIGQPVSVDVYPDRVEIISPGGLWGGKTRESLDDGQSRCRNQTLLQILRDMPLSDTPGPAVEGNGGGIRYMNSMMSRSALPQPEYRPTADTFTVLLGRHGIELPASSEWASELTNRQLTRDEANAVMLARQFPVVNVELLRDQLRMDSDDVRRLLADLTDEGVLHETDGGWTTPPPERDEGPASTRTEDVRARPQAGRSEDIIAALRAATGPLSVRDLSAALDSTPNALRPVLRTLVSAGTVRATAPPTSRNRRYRLADGT